MLGLSLIGWPKQLGNILINLKRKVNLRIIEAELTLDLQNND